MTPTSAHAFTLVELVMSLAIATILLLALHSTVMVASKAIPDGRGVGSRLVNSGPPLATFSSDLFCALSVTEMTPTSITFTVPDRNGDGNPETIRYAWSGRAGDPLTRQYNSGAVVNVIPFIQSLALAYDKRQVQAPTTYTTSAETLLSSNTGGSTSYSVKSTSYPGQYISPSFPVTPNTWSVTRVMVQAKQSSSVGQAAIEIHTADANGYPTAAVLDLQTLQGSNLTGSFAWQTFTFSNATGLSPSQPIVLVVRWVADGCSIEYDNGGLLGGLLGGLFGGGNMEQSNGSSWSGAGGANMNYYLYGTYTTPNPPTYTYYLKDVRCNVQVTSDSAAQLNTSVRILNEPQVTGP